MTALSRRQALQLLGAGALAMPAVGLSSRRAGAAQPVQIILYRYPASEFYADAMRKVPGVELNLQLMPSDKVMELLNINLSSKSANFDIIPTNDTTLISYAKNGWLLPLNDLWQKYKDEYDLGDIEPNFVKGATVDGSQFMVPNEFNTHMLFYRSDLYEEAGLKPPRTIEEFHKNAEALKAPDRAGSTMMCRMGDQCASELGYYLNGMGDGWFDSDWKLTVNSAKGIEAVEFMHGMAKLAQRGFTSAGGEEGVLALCQGFAGQGPMWVTRAAAVNNPSKSRFVGKFGFAPMAQGGQRMSISGYAISRFTKQDPDLLFRIMLESMKKDVMVGNLVNNVPTRSSVLSSDEHGAKFPYLKTAGESAKIGKLLPAMPYFYPLADVVTRRVIQVLTDEMPAKDAMEAAAKEATDLLTSNGFYKT